MENFNGEILQLARQSRCLSQKELSIKVNMKQGIISKYETGKLSPDKDILKTISKVLGFPVNFFTQEKCSFACGLAFNKNR